MGFQVPYSPENTSPSKNSDKVLLIETCRRTNRGISRDLPGRRGLGRLTSFSMVGVLDPWNTLE